MEYAQWRPAAFMKYIDCELLEATAVVEAHEMESDSDSSGESTSVSDACVNHRNGVVVIDSPP